MPSNLYDLEKRISSAWNEGPQVATFVVDFDAQEFTTTIGSSKKTKYASADVVRLMEAIPTGKALCVLAVSTYQDVASTADTSSTIDIGFDGGAELVSNYDGKSAATTKTNTALAAPVYGTAGTYLSVTNTIVEATAGAKLKGKLTISVVYCLV